MEENQLILSFRQLIKLIIGSDKDINNRIDLESNKWKASSDEILSKISDEEKFRSEADLNLEKKIMYRYQWQKRMKSMDRTENEEWKNLST